MNNPNPNSNLNPRKLSSRAKILALLGVVLVIVGIIVTIFLVQRSQDNRGRAAQSATLSLTPPTQNLAEDGSATFDINIDPGENQVNTVKITLKFDGEKFDVTQSDFTIDPASELEIKNGPNIGQGSFSVVLGFAGTDPTKVISTAMKLGDIKLHAKENVEPGESKVDIIYDESEVLLMGENNIAGENTLSLVQGATINIAAVCRNNIATCTWDAVDGAVDYRFKIIDLSDNSLFKSGNEPGTSIEFTAEAGKSYKCEVVAVNACGGVGDAGIGQNACVSSGTPTPTTPQQTGTPTPTPTGVLTSTPTPTTPRTNTGTPTPTTPAGSTSTPTPTTSIGSTATPNPTEIPGVTGVPTLPPTGSPMVLGGIIGGVLIILGGLALLIL